MKYIIKWRNRTNTFKVTTGISVYSDYDSAIKQAIIWQSIFPFNSYYIEAI